LIDKEEEKYNIKESKKDKKLDTSIEIESFVIKLEKEKWQKLLDYYKKDEIKFSISPMQIDILNKYVLGHLFPPSPKPSKNIISTLYRCIR